MPVTTTTFADLVKEARKPCFIGKFKESGGTMFDAVTARNQKDSGWYCEFALRETPKYKSVQYLRDFVTRICRHYRNAELDTVIPKFRDDFNSHVWDEERQKAYEYMDSWKREVFGHGGAIVNGVAVHAGECPYKLGTEEAADWLQEHASELELMNPI